jgi:hypothetical protein
MTKPKFEETNYHLIKQAILDPDSSPLSPTQQEILQRVVSAGKIVDRYPVVKNALKMHMAKYSTLSEAQAYRDIQMARRLFNSRHTFDFDFWHTWLLNDVVSQCQMARTKQDLKGWAAGHANLIKVIGEKPVDVTDPKLIEKHTFIIQLAGHDQPINVNLDLIDKLPKKVKRNIYDNLFLDIDDVEAENLLDS